MIQKVKNSLNRFILKLTSYKVHKDWYGYTPAGPVQYHKYIEYKGKFFVVYLRWKHNDPWTADIIKCSEGDFDILYKPREWNELKINYYKLLDLGKLKEELDRGVVPEWLIKNIK